jgi:hypothetical protein
MPTNNTVKSIGKGIRIGHINARDILSKYKLNDIKIILSRDNYDVFAVTETWLWPQILDNELNSDGYNIARCDRPSIKSYNTRRGGTVVYVKTEYDLKQQDQTFSHPDKVQALKLKISKKYMKPLVIFSIYRTNETPNSFIDVANAFCKYFTTPVINKRTISDVQNDFISLKKAVK